MNSTAPLRISNSNLMRGKNTVLQSVNEPGGNRCVDIFRRPDGSFGFEECRRDSEDGRGWFVIGFFGDKVFRSAEAALEDAREQVAWFDDTIGAESPASTAAGQHLAIEIDNLTRPEVAALLEAHLEVMRAVSPPGSVHALDLDALRAPEVTFWTVRVGGELLGCGALKELDPAHGEIKSMHTAAAARGRGVARLLLEHIVAEARWRGYRRLSLETGSTPDFAAAHALYRGFGFAECGPFADYAPDPFSLFMTLELAPPREAGSAADRTVGI